MKKTAHIFFIYFLDKRLKQVTLPIQQQTNEVLMKHTITIEIHADIDPSTLLEIAQQIGQQIAFEAESYTDDDVIYCEDEVSVATD